MKMRGNLLSIVSLSFIVLLYQNCGEIALVHPDFGSASVANNKISGVVCYPRSIQGTTRYQLASLYVINMNALNSAGELLSDANQNGVPDQFESPDSEDTVHILSIDTDEDGLPDFVEKLKGLNPTVNDLNIDGIDLDGITNRQEIQRGTDPAFSDADVKHIHVDVEALSVSDIDCGEGQPSYSFQVSKIPLIFTEDFTDTKNSVTFNLSHTSKQNNILILAHLTPDDVSKGSVFLAKILKMSVIHPLPVSLQSRELAILKETQDGDGDNGNVQQYQKIATGGHHACGLTSSQKVFCWGANESGQLGDETTLTRLRAVEVKNLPPSKEIALGEQHTCAVSVDGDLYCWGANANGQLGIGSFAHQTAAQKVTIDPVQRIFLGANHSCAELENKIQCWGANANGQLGTGNHSSSNSPVDVLLPSALDFPLKSTSANGTRNCVVDRVSVAYCWGAMPNIVCPSYSQPQKLSACTSVPGLNDNGWSTVLTAGQQHLAMTNDGRISWWSQADFMPTADGGEDEDGLQLPAGRPPFVANALATKISIGAHTCFIEDQAETQPGIFGTVLKCFTQQPGNNYYEPVEYPQVIQPIGISASSSFSCVLDKDGVPHCWGDNSSGQLGTGDYENRENP